MPASRLLEQVRERIRVKHYSLRTEDAYLQWIRRFILFHGKRHPREMSAPEVEAFLSHLATAGRVSPSTQNQALSALLFLYREVLEIELPWLDGVVRAKRPQRIPVVLTESEVRALLAQLDGTRWLVACLLYSSGLRVLEGLRLRVKDVDFERREITVRDGKGARDRRTMLPERLIDLGEVDVLAGEREQVRLLRERQPRVEHHGEPRAPRLGAPRRRQRYHGEWMLRHSQESRPAPTKAYTMRTPWTDGHSCWQGLRHRSAPFLCSRMPNQEP